MSLDLTLDQSEEIRFLNKISETIKRLQKKTHFSNREVEIVLLLYYKLLKDDDDPRSSVQGLISRQQFATFFDTALGMRDNVMIPRIYVALDKGSSSHVTMETWVHTLSLFLRGTIDEKMNYCFKVYDINGDGIIRRDHMMLLLKNSIIKHQDEEVEETVKDLVDIILHRMDIDRDGSLSFQDYSETVRRSPQMLECFGQALPDRGYIHAFSRTIFERVRKF